MKIAPQALLGSQLGALLALERELEHALGRQSALTLAHPELHSSLKAIQIRCAAQAQELQRYLRENGLEPSMGPSPVAPLLEMSRSSGSLARMLCADSAAFSFAAGEYAVLTELSLRLHDPVLRGIAPRHLSSHAHAVGTLDDLLPSVVVHELDQLELNCRCICPMCSLGACGCTETGRGIVREAWRQARPEPDNQPGLTITPPRPGSQLADEGVCGGERLVAVDGQPLTASGLGAVMEVQAGIRKHEIGDELLLAIAHGSQESREVRVRHVSDYPSEGSRSPAHSKSSPTSPPRRNR